MRPRLKKNVHFAAITLLLLLLSWWGMSSLIFFNSDTGLRFWQARELIAHHWQTFAIDYPGRALDPDLQFVPFYCAYSVLQGKVFFDITPFVPLLASFLLPWMGSFGLAIVPVLSGVLAAIGTYKLAKLSGLSRPYLVLWSSVLATPLFFYTLQLWDHSPAVACAVWGVYGVASGIMKRRWQPVLGAGVITAVGIGQRPELYLFALALAGSLLIVSRLNWRFVAALAGGGIIGILPIWWAQYIWVGNPFGMAFAPHLFHYGRPEAYAFVCQGFSSSLKISRFLLYVGGHDPQSFIAALLALVSLFLLIFALRLPKLRKPWLFLVILLLSFVGYLLWGSMLWKNPLPGLLTTFPLAGFSLAYLDQARDRSASRSVYQLVFFTALFFLAGMIIFWPTYGGDHYGGRYLLPVYPLLIFLAFYVYEAYEGERPLQKSLQILGVGLLVIAVSLQILSIRLLILNQQKNVAVYNAIADLPANVILTNHPFLPTTFSSLEDKIFMYVDEEADFSILVPRFVNAGISRFAFISLEDLPLFVPDHVGDISIRQLTPVLYELDGR